MQIEIENRRVYLTKGIDWNFDNFGRVIIPIEHNDELVCTGCELEKLHGSPACQICQCSAGDRPDRKEVIWKVCGSDDLALKILQITRGE